MDRQSIRLPDPGVTTIPTTTSGDIQRTSGADSINRRLLRGAACSPGDLPHRPDFGMGLDDALELPAAEAEQLILRRARRFAKQDTRIAEVSITVTRDRSRPDRASVEFRYLTTDGDRGALDAPIALRG